MVVPESLKTEVLDSLHGGVAGGHLGEDKTLSKLWERFYWPGHTEDVHKWCQGCPQCAQRKTPVPENRAKLTSIYPGYPLQLVTVDILGPLPESCHKNSYVLVVADYFTKWTEAYALPNQEATTVARKLVEEFFLDSLSHTSYIQTKDGSLSQPLSQKFVVYYRLTRQELRRITHSLTAWQSGLTGHCYLRWQLPLLIIRGIGKTIYASCAMHIIPVYIQVQAIHYYL